MMAPKQAKEQAQKQAKEDLDQLVSSKVSVEIDLVSEKLGKSLINSFTKLEEEMCKRVVERI